MKKLFILSTAVFFFSAVGFAHNGDKGKDKGKKPAAKSAPKTCPGKECSKKKG